MITRKYENEKSQGQFAEIEINFTESNQQICYSLLRLKHITCTFRSTQFATQKVGQIQIGQIKSSNNKLSALTISFSSRFLSFLSLFSLSFSAFSFSRFFSFFDLYLFGFFPCNFLLSARFRILSARNLFWKIKSSDAGMESRDRKGESGDRTEYGRKGWCQDQRSLIHLIAANFNYIPQTNS